MNITALSTGIDFPLDKELHLIIHQPDITELSYIDETNFFIAIRFLNINKEEFVKDKVSLESISNFQVFMMLIQDSNNSEARNCVINLLTILFPNYKVALFPKSINFVHNETKESCVIDENNFDILQNVIGTMFCVHSLLNGNKVQYKPKGKKAQDIVDKIMRGREKIAKLKQGENSDSIFGRYISILSVGLGISPLELQKLTVYRLFELMDRFLLHIKWRMDMDIRLAGGEVKTETEDWMKNIH